MNAKDKILEDAAAGRLGFAGSRGETGRVGPVRSANSPKRESTTRAGSAAASRNRLRRGKESRPAACDRPRILGRTGSVLVTRIPAEYGAALLEAFPAGEHDPLARTFRVRGPHKTAGRVLIVTAGSSDAGVAPRSAPHA